MRRFAKRVREIPRWGWGFGLLCLALEYGLYRLGAWFSAVLGTAAYAFPCKIPMIDDRIPLAPLFVVIYLFAYVFWICAPAAISRTGRRNFMNYLAGLALACGVGFLFFVFLPTYMDRAAEGLMEMADRMGPFRWGLEIVYAADGGERAFNLFPSYHCLISAYCYLGVRKRGEISRGYRIYSLVMAVLICLSAMLTKQHYFIDVAGGVGIALLCHGLIQHLNREKGRKRKTQIVGMDESSSVSRRSVVEFR